MIIRVLGRGTHLFVKISSISNLLSHPNLMISKEYGNELMMTL